tara:strand:+ start:916 stop:1269 length:354 start_codon:yes stop_codon:yes gene_type:complete
MPAQRTLDLLKESFDLSKRRKFDVKDDNGNVVVSLYFKAITRADRARATQRAGSDDALVVSTHMLCQLAELEDGTKAFHPSDFGNLQTELPENVLNEIEMFLFGVNPNVTVEAAKEA